MAMKHMGMTIAFARQYVQAREAAGETQDIFTRDGQPVPTSEVYEGLAEWERDGFTLIPCHCGAYDRTGACTGIIQHA